MQPAILSMDSRDSRDLEGGATNHLELHGAAVNIRQPLLNMKSIIGKWRLIEMEQWDQEFIDLVEPGYIAFKKGGTGEMVFGAVNLSMAWEETQPGKAEFTFEGFDEMDQVSGRGSAGVASGRLAGKIAFHQGERSEFQAERWTGRHSRP